MAGGGGKEPNLTPLIDLFSVLIVFLLLTAAWTQLEVFQVTINEKPKLSPDTTVDTPPPEEEKKEEKVKLVFELYDQRVVAKKGESVTELAYNQIVNREPAFIRLVEEWKALVNDKNPIAIESKEGAKYGQLIKVYDELHLAGIDFIAISPY